MKFTEFGFEPGLIDGLDAMGFEKATPIQEQAIPFIMEGKDVLACAQTGTGKTAAFLLPIINSISKQEHEGIHTLVIGPTRELVMQVDQQLEAFSYFTGVSGIPIYGGRGGQEMVQEKRALKQGVDMIIATPGRFKMHLELGYVDLSTVKCLILDEADRMLDMGFAPDITNIINKLPPERQTLLFSATMPAKIRKFAQQFLKKPEEISIAISKPAENILQGVYEVSDRGKIPLTARLLKDKKDKKALIFASTKKKVRDLDRELRQNGLKTCAIHSDLEQKDREQALLEFKNGTTKIAVATDVLSRGIDINDIDLVINFDVPSDGEDYVHRIGRTARAEASGVALTYINGEDAYKFKRIEELIDMKIHRIPLPPELSDYKADMSKKGRSSGGRGGYRGNKGGGRGRGRGSSNRGRRK
ncbi:MAG TPA: DEAD/DEAH box helicase [Saprospiraceae bacterium]|nr:DEAD/DEAH box helicase [Saprospiraceae bacterium]